MKHSRNSSRQPQVIALSLKETPFCEKILYQYSIPISMLVSLGMAVYLFTH